MEIRKDTVSIDWYQGTHPHASTRRLQNTISRTTREQPRLASGRRHPSGKFSYPHGLYWLNGAIELHHFGDLPSPRYAHQMPEFQTRRSWLIIKGSGCSQVGFSGVHTIAQYALLGGTCTRLDVRRDLHGEDLSLVEDVIDSCTNGHLRLSRQWQQFPIRSAEGLLIGNGCYLGSPKSERFIRCYDKGLEQQTHPSGCFHRYECELKADHAHEAAVSIFSTPDESQALQRALTILLGVADFRIGPRGSGADRYRLPRPHWWQRFIGELDPVRPALPHRDPDIARYTAHAALQLSACFGAAHKLGWSVHRVMDALGISHDVTPTTLKNPLVDLIVAYLERQDESSEPSAASLVA